MSKKSNTPLPPVLAVVLDLLRDDRDNWTQFVVNWVEVDAVLMHTPTGVRVNISHQHYAQVFVPGVGNFTFHSAPEIAEAAKLISELGNQIRAILALRILSEYTPPA